MLMTAFEVFLWVLVAVLLLSILYFTVNRILHLEGPCPIPNCGAWFRWRNVTERIIKRDENMRPLIIVVTESIDCKCGSVIELGHERHYKQGRFFRKKILEHIQTPAH